jgi:hypothetical protein
MHKAQGICHDYCRRLSSVHLAVIAAAAAACKNTDGNDALAKD